MADTPKRDDDLAEVLGNLADGKPAEPTEPAERGARPDGQPDDRPEPSDAADDLEGLAGSGPAIGDDAVAMAFDPDELGVGEGGAAGSRRRPSGAGRVRRPAAPTPLARMGVKLCLVIGMLLLIPALWAVGILVKLPVPLAGRSSATAMAMLMLLCWPVGGALIWGAFHFARQHARFDAAQKIE